MCLKRLSNGKWRCTETNDYFYKPVIRECSPTEVVARYADVEPRVATLLQKSNEILIESPDRAHCNPIVVEDHEVVAECIEEDGHYLVVNESGGMLEGQVFTRVLDYNGNPFPAHIFLGGDSHALQEHIVGQKTGDVDPNMKSGSLETGAEGVFVGKDEHGQLATLPFKVTNVGRVCNYMVAQAVGITNEQLAFVMMPGVTRLVNATGIADSIIGGHLAGNVFFVPPSFHFVPAAKKVKLCSDPRQVQDLLSKKIFMNERLMEPFSVETTRKGHSRALRVISGIDGTFTLKGAILETLNRDYEVQGLTPTKCHWVMALLGVTLPECARITALAVDRGECNVSNLRPAKASVKKDQIHDRNLADLASAFRRNLFKEASTFTDPKAVDATLSLNFVNENNLMQFMQNLPAFQETERKLAELYLYTQLGLKEQVPDQAVLQAMKAVNEVNEHLEYLAAMLRQPAAQGQGQPTIA